MMKRFKMLYNKVFDENGEVTLCGREACQELILLSDQIERNISHGNPETGFMDIQAIKSLNDKYNRT